MRIAPASILPLAALSACLVLGCGIAQLSQGGGGGTSGGAADGGTDATVEAGVQGANCGIESGSGQQLCQATSICPTLVVDTQAFPHCGFRIKGGATELICACGQLLCSMGTYTTCTQAAALLTSQTEQQVCTQLAEDRCSPGAAASSSGSSGTSGTSGTSGSSGATGTCDHQCLSDCGGGGGCASICGC